MAKLRPYFGLCPIIDQKSLLGISEDVTPGNVIITLDKNISVLYKISDQSQVKSWRTKDKFTTPVIYVHEKESYCAAFNRTHLRFWYHQDSLDNLKKYKFKQQIHTLLTCRKKTFIVFENGTIGPLKSSVDQRKDNISNDVIDVRTDKIVDVSSQYSNGTIYVALFVQCARGTSVVWTAFKEHMQTDYVRFELGTTLQGYTLFPINDDAVSLLALRSDGRLYSYSMDGREETLGSFDALSYKERVTMCALDGDYVAMYGSNRNEEGAALIIYNVQFRVTQSRQSLKMFSSGSRLWSLENCIFVCVGQHLAVVPFYLAVEQLAALVGSHKATKNSDADVEVVEDFVECRWEEKVKAKVDVKVPFEAYVEVGWSERLICEAVVPDFIDGNDLEGVVRVLKHLTDIPEKYIVKLLRFTLSAEHDLFEIGDENPKVPAKLGPKQRCQVIDSILVKKCDNVALIKHLRTQLDVTSAVLLLRYISYMLSEDGHSGVGDEALVFWATTIIDSHYRQFVSSKDETVREVLVYVRDLVTAYTYALDEMQGLMPLLVREERLLQDVDKESRMCGSSYTIERLSLYL